MVSNMRALPERCEVDFSGRLVVITGATSGIGYHTARKYASKGAKLLMINRNKERSVALHDELRADFGTECDYLVGDLSRLDDMHRLGQALAQLDNPIDVLIHNAGLYLSRRTLTIDGLEMHFAVHFLAPLVINHLITDKLISQERGRIIYVSSEGYRFVAWGMRLDDLTWEKRRYSGLRAYGAAKMGQILTMRLFAESFQGTGVTINAMHPGMVKTNTGKENQLLYRRFKHHIIDRFSGLPHVSAEALYYLGVSPEIEGVSGRFFHLTREEELAPPARDREVAERLWEISLSLGRLR
jgi:NAD(P)-dependent dehydrogenase (short-subunit alcohol dehydrogenase family)